jgi:hypothetical protein
MSWIVQILLRNSVELKSNQSLDSDDYTNLLIIEKKIYEMYQDKLLSDSDIELIENISDGKPFRNLGNSSKSALSLAKRFYSLCDRIAYALGGEFTDDGYLEYMKNKYKLNEEQLEKLRKYMKGIYKYKIMRKIIND